MKQLRLLTTLIIALAGIWSGCHQAIVLPPAPVVPTAVTLPDTTPPGPAQITGITIEGIPEDNISIDQATRLITVVVPEVPTLVESAVSVTVTAGYTLYPKGSGYLYRFNLFYSNSPLPLYSTKNDEVASYKLIRKQTRPLAIDVSEKPLILSTGSPLAIPVKNYYEEDNGGIAVLTNTQTGQQIRGRIEGLPSFYDKVYAPNQVWANFDADLPAGEYTLDIVKNSGRTARSSQLVTIKRGLPSVHVDYWYPFNTYPGGQGVRVIGANLYADDQIEFLLTNRAGQSYKLTPTTYAADGKRLTLDIPATLPPVPYAVQLMRKGQPVDSYSRLVVRKDVNQPAIDSFWNIDVGVSPTQTIVLQRGKAQLFAPIYSPNVSRVRLRFIAVSNPAKDYLVDAFHTDGYFSFGPDAGYPDFTIPVSVPPGRYTVVLQHILRDGTLVEGEPLERDVEIR